MTARENRLLEIKHERYLHQEYGPLCRAAGYDIAQLSGTDCFTLATRIMGATRDRACYIVKGCFGSHDYLGALKNMSQSELSEMRERIGYRPWKRSSR
jgi:hypothetical protein